MAIVTNFFDGSSYGASALIAPWASLLGDGVFSQADLTVGPNSPAGLSVVVAPGAAVKSGYFVKSDASVTVSIGSNTSGYNRIDLIVLDVDTINKVSTFKALQGIPASSPVAPTPGALQLPLAQVLVGNNASALDVNVISDARAIATSKARAGVPNLLINGNFDIWQRGQTANYNLTAAGFVADRWMQTHGFTSGYAATVSRLAMAIDDVPGALYAHRYACTAAAAIAAGDNAITQQKIENGVRALCGAAPKKITISFWARSNVAGKKLGIQAIQSYGSGGSPSADDQLVGKVVTLTNAWTKYTITLDTVSTVGKTFGSNNDDNLVLRFWYVWGSSFSARFDVGGTETFAATGYADIAQVKLEAGAVATPFVPRQRAEELVSCQRYFEKSYDLDTAPGSLTTVGAPAFKIVSDSAGYAGTTIAFKVSKRALPTMTAYDHSVGTAGKWRYQRSGVTETQVDASFTVAGAFGGQNTTYINILSGANWVPVIMYGHWTADAEL